MSHEHDHHHDHGHGHPHPHDHGSSHPHRHDHGSHGTWTRIRHAVGPHSHAHDSAVDAALESSAQGMRALWISLAGLAATACAQAVVVALSGSVALLGDTLHNSADALTAVPLGIAFMLGRRRPTRRYTYGYGRAEDLAGVIIVAVIVLSSAAAAFAAVQRLLHPHPVTHLLAVAIAAVLGFAGNELWPGTASGPDAGSARPRWSPTACTPAPTGSPRWRCSSARAGWRSAGLGRPGRGPAHHGGHLAVGWQAAREVGRRLMDSVDPALTELAETTLRATPGVLAVGPVRLRWVGRTLRAECVISVDPSLSVIQAHAVAVAAEHALIHAIPTARRRRGARRPAGRRRSPRPARRPPTY